MLEKRLGRGAVAEVWKARDTVERRAVALKLVLPEAVEQFGRDQIEREARIGVRLQHPNIVAIRNADWIDGRFVLATELAVSPRAPGLSCGTPRPTDTAARTSRTTSSATSGAAGCFSRPRRSAATRWPRSTRR